MAKWRGLAWAGVWALAACGGGGGGGSTPASTPALELTPRALSSPVELDVGVPKSFAVRARPMFTATGTVYVVIVDTSGVLNPQVSIAAQPDGSYLASLSTAGLARGHYAGEIEVRVCPVSNCQTQFPGSPVKLPFDFTVGVTPNLTALSALPGAPDWATVQGNLGHTGHVPVTLDASRFNTRWRWATAVSGLASSPAVTANGVVFVALSNPPANYTRTPQMTALREADGTEQWTRSFPAQNTLSPPSVQGGTVFAASSNLYVMSLLWGLDPASGAPKFQRQMSSSLQVAGTFNAPTVTDTRLYLNANECGCLAEFDPVTGNPGSQTSFGSMGQSAPAADASYVYDNVSGRLYRLLRSTGAVDTTFSFADGSWEALHSQAAPVLPGDGTVLARTHGAWELLSPTQALTRVDASFSSARWSVAGSFATDPVTAAGVVYVANLSPAQVEARSLATGALLWSWPLSAAGDSGYVGNLLLTSSHLFVSTGQHTHALDLNTHASAWSTPRIGHKALSANGVLTISTMDSTGASDGGVSAFNLR